MSKQPIILSALQAQEDLAVSEPIRIHIEDDESSSWAIPIRVTCQECFGTGCRDCDYCGDA